MFKHIFLASIILSGLFNANNDLNIVESIEYNSNNQIEGYITFDISLSTNDDYITAYISFSNEQGDSYDKYYKKTIYVNGSMKTIMRLPMEVDRDKIYVHFRFDSYHIGKEIFSISMPVYRIISSGCNLNEAYHCVSKFPSIVTYINGKLVETNEEISIDYKGNTDNKLSLDSIKIFANNYSDNLDGTLYIYTLKDEINIYNDGERYIVPLNVTSKGNLITVAFANDYYVDEMKGITNETYEEGYMKSKEIIFPYIYETYHCYLEIQNVSTLFESVSFDFYYSTMGNLIGNCLDSKYCIRRNYL